jgi:hypothetical protein
MRMAAVFTISICTIALRTNIVRRWLAFLGLPIALVLLLAASAVSFLTLLFPAWILLVSLDILVNNMRGKPALVHEDQHDT